MENESTMTIESAYSKIEQDSKDMIDGIKDLEYKAKAYKALKKLYEESVKSSEEKKKRRSHKKYNSNEVVKDYKNFLSSRGLAPLTVKDYAMEAKKFLSYLVADCILIYMVSQTNIDEYLSTARDKRNLSKNSYSKVVVSLKKFLQFLKERDILEVDITKIKTTKKVKPVTEVLNREDVAKLGDYFKSRKEKFKGENIRDKVILGLGLWCALRRSEIINLNWEDIDFKNYKIMIRNSKGGKSRPVYFKDNLEKALKKYQRCFKFYKGAVIRGKCRRRISKASLQNLVRRIYKEAKIYRKGLSIHSLRHYCADRLRRKGVDIQTIKSHLGHSDIGTTEGYLHSSEKDLKKAATI